LIRVKICGITHADDAALCVEEGADALGFVVEYPLPTPWTLTRAQAAELVSAVPPFVTRVAVVGGDARTLLGLAEVVTPDALQLHGDEGEEVVRELRWSLAGSGVRLVKALRVDATRAEPVAYWIDQARRFVDAGADALLVDSVTASRPAGTGLAVDRSLARAVVAAAGVPCVLAGGLNPENVAGAVAEVGPFAVDVISSVEDDAHRKVRDRVRAFVGAAKGL
jgi:phosphoribosylanthranilate isomerase